MLAGSRTVRRIAAIACAGLCSIPGWIEAHAQESPLCLAPDDAYDLRVVPAGTGAIFVWADERDTSAFPVRLYAQRVDAGGVPQWTVDGVRLCAANGDQLAHVAVSDGAGGAIAVWVDNRALPAGTQLYAQRIGPTGVTMWAAAGALVSTVAARGLQSPPAAVPDGVGGVFVAWETEDPVNGIDIQAQHLGPIGNPMWTAAGIRVCGVAGDQKLPVLCRAFGGVAIAWQDGRAGALFAPDPYAQELSGGGLTLWAAGGVPVTASAGGETELAIASDGVGGAILSWRDDRNGLDSDIYAQRLSPGGLPQWDGPEPGPDLRICGAVSDQARPQMVRPTPGRTVIGWADRRGADWDIYAQAVDDAGFVAWAIDGVAVSAAAGNQWLPNLSADSSTGEALFVWFDERDAAGVSEIYGQRLSSGGAPQWAPDGLLLVDQPLAQRNPVACVTGAAQAMVAWEDGRSDVDWDLYTRPVALTTVAVPEAVAGIIPRLSVAPNPTRGTAEFEVTLAHGERISLVLVDVNGRLVRRVYSGAASEGKTGFTWNGRDDGGRPLPAGVYFLRVTSRDGVSLARRVVLAR